MSSSEPAGKTEKEEHMKKVEEDSGSLGSRVDLIFVLKTQVFSAYLGRGWGNKASQRTFSGTCIKNKSHVRRIVVRTVGFSGMWRGSCQSLGQGGLQR